MSDDTVFTGTITCPNGFALPGGRRLPPGHVLAKFACRSPEEARFIQQRIGWSAFVVRLDDTVAEAEQAACAAQAQQAAEDEAAAAAAEDTALIRKGSLSALAKVSGIGPRKAERLVDHYRLRTRHSLLAVLSDPASCDQLVADRELRVSERDLDLWRRQLQAEQVIDDEDEGDDADTTDE